jgi:methylthioribose-1-phosphate isomerase
LSDLSDGLANPPENEVRAEAETKSLLALRYDDGRLHVLDQTALPDDERWLELRSASEAAAAIRRLAVRGAPLIGIAAAYALAVELARDPGGLDAAAAELRAARPTAVNLAWAVDRVVGAARGAGLDGAVAAAVAAARAIHEEQDAAGAAIGRHGADLLAGARHVLTHCNTGTLACGAGGGTAMAVLAELAARGPVEVLACETRPLLQGARLTVWELDRLGIPHALCVDGAAAGIIARGEVDAVVVGADRVAANGDVANKVGTYAHALAARAAGIPFVVAAPSSTLDPDTPTGADIVIEERDGDEVRRVGGREITLAGTPVRNPAFDVTPAELVTALVTERGVLTPATAS